MSTPPASKPTGMGLKFFRAENVLEMAKRRIAWLLDEFPNFFVAVSGGKDSTVLFHLALQVAREKGRLPLKVFWIDQEAEWASTVATVEQWMTHPDVAPLWLQVPFRIFNATSTTDHWLRAWDPDAESQWIHGRHPVALTENVYGTDRFHKLFPAALAHHFGDGKACSISAIRCEEARTRTMGLTYYASYKWITWASVADKTRDQYTFYPLYDWSLSDVWHAIATHGWAYNSVYDRMYQHGIPVTKMRVSNLHHETAVWQLFFLQEVEPDTYERLVARIGGIDMAGKFANDYFPRELPWMFESWREYRDHLLVNLIEVPEWREHMAAQWERDDAKTPPDLADWLHKGQVKSILTQDWEGAKIEHIVRNQGFMQAQRAFVASGQSRQVGAAAQGGGERLESEQGGAA